MTETAVLGVPVFHVTYGIRGFPLSATKPTDVEGVDFDQYDSEEEHAEIFVVPEWVPIIGGKCLWNGNLSTYREIHIAIRGFYAGLRCKQDEDLPKCPILWAEEGQYYEGYAAIAYDLKRGSQGAIIGSAVTVIGIIKALGWL